jgi:hypothetical protein
MPIFGAGEFANNWWSLFQEASDARFNEDSWLADGATLLRMQIGMNNES